MPSDLLSLCLLGRMPALPGTWMAAWSLAPAWVLPLLVWLAVALRRPSGRGRAAMATPAVAGRPLWIAGWCLLAVALVSPLCRLAATLVSGHMAQLLVLSVAAPLLLAIGGSAPARHGARPPGTGLVPATLAYAAVLWLRHLPALYDAVLASPWVHVAVVALVVASGLWFWHAVLQAGRAGAGGTGRAVLALVATTAHTGLLGALLTFAPTPFYPLQAGGAAGWGLSALEDQQLAGMLMWVPGSLAYLATGIALVLRQVRADDRLATGPATPSKGLWPTAQGATD
ncbi:cytochrome c oxidase assembly protein [Sphingomonas sp. NCPPB 2930]